MSENLKIRRRRALYRASRRGMKEMDLVLGSFASQYAESMEDPDLADFEALLDCNDQQLNDWFMGVSEVPQEWSSPLVEKLVEFCRSGDLARHGGAS